MPLEVPAFAIEDSAYRYDGWLTPIIDLVSILEQEKGAITVEYFIDWTTNKDEVPPENQIEKGAVIQQEDGTWEIFMADAAKNTDPGASGTRTNYSVWKADEDGSNAEAGRKLRLRYRTADETGAWAVGQAVPGLEDEVDPGPGPTPPNPEPGNRKYVRVNLRTPEQKKIPSVGGEGMQFLRGFTPDDGTGWFFGAMDAAIGWASHDLGKHFYTPRQVGNWNSSGCCAWGDPDNGGRCISMYSNGGRLDDNKTDSTAYDGLYLSTDKMETCKQVAKFLCHSTQTSRHNLTLIAHDPTTKGASRRVVAMQRHGPSASSTDVIQLWESLKNGDAPWNKKGPKLSVSKYASGENSVTGLIFTDEGVLIQWGRKGAWYSTDKGATDAGWKPLGGLPAGKEVHRVWRGKNGDMLAAVKESGLYRSSNGKDGYVKNAALGQYNITEGFCHVADLNVIWVCTNSGGTTGKISIDDGKSWSDIKFEPCPGLEVWSGAMGNNISCYAVPSKTDPKKLYVHTSQVHSTSDNANQKGMVVKYGGLNFGGSHIHGLTVNPDNYREMYVGIVDKVAAWSGDGMVSMVFSEIFGKSTDNGKKIAKIVEPPDGAGVTALHGGAAVMHPSGRVVFSAGDMPAGKTLIIIDDPEKGDKATQYTIRDLSPGFADYHASIHPKDDSIAFIGKIRIENFGAANRADVKFVDMGKSFGGITVEDNGQVIIWGYDGDKGSKTLYKSTDIGKTWKTWYVTKFGFRNYGTEGLAVMSAFANSQKIILASEKGKVITVEGSAPAAGSEKVIFDPKGQGNSEFMKEAATHPNCFAYHVTASRFDEKRLYVCMAMHGVEKPIWTTGDDGTEWESFQDMANTHMKSWEHPITGDVFFIGAHGTHLRPAYKKQAKSLWDEHNAYLDTCKD